MALAPGPAVMMPLPAPSPIATTPARNAGSAAGASEAAGAFALLLAGVMPITVPAAAQVAAPLGKAAARLDVDPAGPGATTGLPGVRSPSGAPAGADAVPAGGQGPTLQAPAGTSVTPAPTGADPRPERSVGPALPSIVDPDRPPAPPLDRGQGAVRQSATDRPGLASIPSDGAEPTSQAAPGTLGQWTADAELADRPSAEARPTRTNASDPRAAQGDAPRAAPETLAGAVGQTASDRSDNALLESSPKPVAGQAEPEGRSSAGAAEPGPEAEGPAPTLRPAAAATPSGIAAGAPRIEASVETGDGAPGRTERMPGETPGPAGRPLPPAPVVQLGIHVASAASRRVERLVVQLEPAALGRVEVRLDFSHDNRVSAVVAAERPETLDLLQRDSRALERGLQDAGLRLDQNALSFSLRQEQRGQERGAGTPGAWPIFEASTGSDSGADRPGDARPAYWIGAHRVLDIRI